MSVPFRQRRPSFAPPPVARPARRAALAALVAAGTLGFAAGAARGDASSPQPHSPGGESSILGWYSLGPSGTGVEPLAPNARSGKFSVQGARYASGVESTIGTCFDTGSYYIPGATYRIRFAFNNLYYGTMARYEIRRGPNRNYGTVINETPINDVSATWVDVQSAPFTLNAADTACLNITSGSWGGTPWSTTAVDDLALEVVSYPVPVAAGLPEISTPASTLRAGAVVTHVPVPSWSIAAPYPFTRTITWLSCDAHGDLCTPVGTAGASYEVGAADIGKTIRVRESLTNADGETTAVVSTPTTVVEANPPTPPTGNAPPPAGGNGLGNQLVASPGAWGGEGLSFTYQWVRCDAPGVNCVPIPGATASTYTLGAADAGKYVYVQITGTNGAGSATRDSGGLHVASPSGLLPAPGGGTGGGGPAAPSAPGAGPSAPANRPSAPAVVSLTASLGARAAVAKQTVLVAGRLRGVAGGGHRVAVTLRNPQWGRFTRTVTVRTAADGTFRVRVRPVVSATVSVAYAGTRTTPGAALTLGTVTVAPVLRLAVYASPDGGGTVKNLRIRGRFAPTTGPRVLLQLEGYSASHRRWFRFCPSKEQVRVSRSGVISGTCSLRGLLRTNRYRLVHSPQPGSPYGAGVSAAVAARVTS